MARSENGAIHPATSEVAKKCPLLGDRRSDSIISKTSKTGNIPMRTAASIEICASKNQEKSQKSESKKSESKSHSEMSIRQRKLQIEIEKIEELNALERQFEEKELERQKRLLGLKASLKIASVCDSHECSSKASIITESEEAPLDKVQRWLSKEVPAEMAVPGTMATAKEPFTSTDAMTVAVEKLAVSLKEAIRPKQLPTFSGRPEEWPMFYSAFEKTMKSFSEDDNLVRLRSCLEGEALKMTKPLFVSSKNLSAIIKTLQMRFGRPEFIIESMMKRTKSILPVKEDDIAGLIEFSTVMLNFTSTTECLHMEEYLSNPQLLSELTNKLPYSLKYSWAQHVSSMDSKPDLEKFSGWLEKQCSLLSIYFRPPEDIVVRKKNDPKHVFTSSGKEEDKNKCMFCPEKHNGESCRIFRKSDVSQRWKMVVENKLCFFCFGRHQLKYCKAKRTCGIKGCKLFHHRLLHTDDTDKHQVKETISNHVNENFSNRVLLRVCPVTLYGPTCHIDTYALLDDGSTVSLIDSKIAEKLQLKGETDPLTTCWSNSTHHFEPLSRRVSLRIKGLFEDEVFSLSNVRTQSTLDLPRQSIDSVKLKERWSHLSSISQPLPSAHTKPTILIGQNNCELILSRRVIEGPPNSPALSWTYLGWTLHGKCAEYKGRIDEEFTLTVFQDEELHEIVKESLQIDNYGQKLERVKQITAGQERAVSILENTVRKVQGRYEAGLLWKSDDFSFPPSYGNALKRLESTERKMRKDVNFKKEYVKKIAEYVEKGYARKLSKDEANTTTDRTFYLPHFGVTNPNKPNKLRLVFDAAARSQGVSFNDALLSGPDYLNSLPSVLLNFRQGKFAVVGDIKEMFHQVRIKKEDADSQRFLWGNGDNTRKPDIYVMEAMTFGSTCSPSTALYVVNLNARNFMSIFPEASQSIISKEYMDDLLDSTDTVDEAKRRVREIIQIHKSGGFQMCNWLSNSKEALQDIPEELKANSVKRIENESDLPTERVLGMWWDASSDKFVFHRSTEKLKVMEKEYPTKREVLRAAMSIFDPLGLVTPTTIKGRMLIQKIWRTKITWDEVLSPGLCKIWQNWLEEVRNLQHLEIQRRYFDSSNLDRVELHTFVDASEEAFAAVAYLRLQSASDTYKTVLVMARAKVAPLKTITVPRLELQAALLGCRMACTIQSDLQIPIARRMYWSDSVTVLHWVKSEPSFYKQFVSNRISEIQELSANDEWRWVPSKLNPADIATRESKRFEPNVAKEWLRGPSFLSGDSSQWPSQPSTLNGDEYIEMKKQLAGQFTGCHTNEKHDVLEFERFSSWEKLIRVAAWILKYIQTLKLRTKSALKDQLQVTRVRYETIPELQPEHIRKAEQLILRMSQNESFKEEEDLLMKGKKLPKSSRIYALSPFLDQDKLIRMSARTRYSPELTHEQKHPIILDGKSHIARMIVKMLHETCLHQGVETVICEVRKKFWILNCRATVKKVKNCCMKCRISHAKPKPPQMAPLPPTRVTRVEHPFFFTGVDYFGPIEVTVGRRHEKRWGVLFTCLSTRAIHLEVAHSLNTESCIMAIQRFIGRRPCPSEMFSDNGTNFVAADKELRNSIKSLNHAQIQRTVASQGMKWNFIPPRAPHMGGCWERLIKSVKIALRCILKSQHPRDEELHTFLVRVEFIINSRPLTHVSVDPKDESPLTPNHFLREAFKVSVDEDKLCKKQFARVRSLLDSFWKRWVHEYLPCLTRRCRWHGPVDPPKIGDLAIIVEESNPRNTWPLGRIAAVYPGRDGQIRIVDVTTSKGTFRRPLTKVAILSSGGEMM